MSKEAIATDRHSAAQCQTSYRRVPLLPPRPPTTTRREIRVWAQRNKIGRPCQQTRVCAPRRRGSVLADRNKDAQTQSCGSALNFECESVNDLCFRDDPCVSALAVQYIYTYICMYDRYIYTYTYDIIYRSTTLCHTCMAPEANRGDTTLAERAGHIHTRTRRQEGADEVQPLICAPQDTGRASARHDGQNHRSKPSTRHIQPAHMPSVRRRQQTAHWSGVRPSAAARFGSARKASRHVWKCMHGVRCSDTRRKT